MHDPDDAMQIEAIGFVTPIAGALFLLALLSVGRLVIPALLLGLGMM